MAVPVGSEPCIVHARFILGVGGAPSIDVWREADTDLWYWTDASHGGARRLHGPFRSQAAATDAGGRDGRE